MDQYNEFIYMKDFGAPMYSLIFALENNNINLDDITILPNGTDLGNDRIPWVRKRVKTHE